MNPLINFKTITPLRIRFVSSCGPSHCARCLLFRQPRMLSGLLRRTEAIRASIQLRVKMRSSASPPGSPTRPTVLLRSISNTHRQRQYGQWLLRRSLATQPAFSNTANGFNALYEQHNRHNNTANGLNALCNNTTGNDNTANGRFALHEQHNRRRQHGQRSLCALRATQRQQQHGQRCFCAR